MVAYVCLFCFERDLMMSLSDDKQANIVDAYTLHPDISMIS